ncbi:SIMPL domain-containing protein [Streptomyces sp. NPDC050803]|uniref:SIMPL domain-containing protein n=1 Tax=unclassified Streptomyces TaxID=2593676 RepID=UPI00342B23C1
MPAPLPRTTVTLAVTLLALGLPALAAAPATALTSPVASATPSAPSVATVTVTGVGSANAAPDLAVVSAGVEVVGKTPQEALDAQNKAAQALLDAVREHGVADGDIRTEGLSLTPVYKYEDGSTLLTGYQAAQIFSVKVRNVDATGKIVEAIATATGDAGRIHGIAFDVADRSELHTRARKAAYKDAHAKALQYADLSGRKLGPLVSLNEASSGGQHPVPLPADAPAGGAGVPVAPGEIQETVTVTAVYELA